MEGWKLVQSLPSYTKDHQHVRVPYVVGGGFFFVRSTQRPIHFRPSVLIKSNHTQSVFRIPARFMADEGRSAHTDNGRARTASEQVDKVKLVY